MCRCNSVQLVRQCMYYDRNERKMVCLTQPLDDNQPGNTLQSVVVRRATGVKDTGFKFTYKPNPEIHGIQQTITALTP